MASIETVRGRLSAARAEQILDFWSAHGMLRGDAARERLPEVVCIALGGDEEILGLNYAYPGQVPLIGRPFWVYRSFLAPEAGETGPQMFNAAFAALAEDFEPAAEGPLGLCLAVSDREAMERSPEPIWLETGLMYAGYTPDGIQVRIRYFDEAIAGPGLPSSPTMAQTRDHDYTLPDRYRVEAFGEGDVTAEQVMALWHREAAMTEAEARRRVDEVMVAVRDRDGGVVAVSSAYLRRNEQLRMDLWHSRVFVAQKHRGLGMAVRVAQAGRDVLDERFAAGEDTRAGGMLFEVESVQLRRYYNRAIWPPTDFTFIGENQRGEHVRVHYFPGSRVPLPT